jgi:hypothetical protein
VLPRIFTASNGSKPHPAKIAPGLKESPRREAVDPPGVEGIDQATDE